MKSLSRRMASALAKGLPGFTRTRDLVLKEPTDWIVRGFLIESSSDATERYVHGFVQPLHVPAETVVLNLGVRIRDHRNFERWRIEGVDELIAAARSLSITFLGGTDTPSELVHWHHLGPPPPADYYARRAYLYSLVLDQQEAKARPGLVDLADELGGTLGWRATVRGEVLEMLGALDREPDAARSLLDTWRQRTRTALKL